MTKAQKIYIGQTIHALVCLGYSEPSIENFIFEISRSMESVSSKDALCIAKKFSKIIDGKTE